MPCWVDSIGRPLFSEGKTEEERTWERRDSGVDWEEWTWERRDSGGRLAGVTGRKAAVGMY